MKNNDKSNLNDKELENISGGNRENKIRFRARAINFWLTLKGGNHMMMYGGPSPIRRHNTNTLIDPEKLMEKRKKQDEKEGAEPLLPATPEKEDK